MQKPLPPNQLQPAPLGPSDFRGPATLGGTCGSVVEVDEPPMRAQVQGVWYSSGAVGAGDDRKLWSRKYGIKCLGFRRKGVCFDSFF